MITQYKINDFIPDPNTGKDRWQVHKIFKGGMGIVYIVYDIEFREAFAVKTYQDKLQSAQAKEQFRKEANIWINLDRHENIAWARLVWRIHNRLYLFLEYVPGGDLSRWIGTKRLDLKQVLLFALQFCYGMEHALAKGVKAHRDIKPQNCLITEDGTLKITDFGLAKALDVADDEQALSQPSDESITTTRTGQVGGTLPYIAPEQFDDLKHIDARADVYSFGIMLYEMICEDWPFTGSTYEEFREKHQKAPVPDLPPFSIPQVAPLEDIVQKCLAKKPRERYADFSQLRRELAHLYEIFYSEEVPSPKKEHELSARNLSNKGVALINLGRHEEALTCFEHALEKDPKSAMTWDNKGVALANLGWYKEALTCHNKALKIDKKYANAWSNKGNALSNLERYEEAINCLDHAIEISPKSAKVWYNKGNILGSMGRYEEEISCLDYALEIDPKDTNIWYNKGNALLDLGRYDEAVSCYDHAIEIDPKKREAWSNRGNALENLGRYNEAINCCNHVIEINPKGAKAWYNKGVVLTKLGHYEEAIKCYNHALEIDPKAINTWYNKGILLIELGRYEKAISCCDHALEIDPKFAEAWNNKGFALAMIGRLHEALVSFVESYKLGYRQAVQGIEYCQRLLPE